MYTKKVPFKDLHDKPQNMPVHFHLFPREIYKLILEFQAIYSWLDRVQQMEAVQDIPTEELLDFFNNFETIVLAAWGVPSADGLSFDRSGVYDFEQSVLFAATMDIFVSDPTEVTKLLDEMMPKNLQDTVKNADENLAKAIKDENTDEETKKKLAALQAQIEELKGS